MAMADKMVELNLKAYGYEYVNIDDCWPAKERDPETGKLVADPDRFPSGISALADYVRNSVVQWIPPPLFKNYRNMRKLDKFTVVMRSKSGKKLGLKRD